MSSDDYFDGELDSAMLNEIDAIEAAHFSPSAKHALTESVLAPPRALVKEDSDFFDSSFDIDESELQRIDEFIEDAYQGKAGPVAGPSTFRRTASKQMTLFGDVLQGGEPSKKPSSSSRSNGQKTKTSSRNPFGQQAKKTKVWDQTAFAKTGWKKPKSAKGKGKVKASFDYDQEEEVEEEVEFEQFPAPFVSGAPPPSMKLTADLLEAKHWIYPLNQSKRDYQFNIVKHCLFENTLVALPTGLGKTFIAGVVMLNFYRWFPTGKTVFLAPTKPLVAQQIDACHKTCGIPGNDAAELTGQNPRPMRARAWQNKRVFYMTPQTFMNDLTSENCDPRDIVLVVIDEAHKGTGDYAYAQVIRYLMAKNPHFRVLALTATPGSTPDAVQAIVDTLHISRIEIRDENSLDLKEYMHKKTIKQHVLRMSDDIIKVKDLLAQVMETTIKPLKNRNVIPGHTDVVNMHSYRPQAIIADIMSGHPARKTHMWAISALKTLGALCRAMGYLLEGTMGMCYTCLQELNREPDPDPGKKKPASSKIRSDPGFQAVLQELDKQRSRGFSPHPKMERLKALVLQHFAENANGSGEGEGAGEQTETRAIVFVTFREAVDEIVEELNREKPLVRASKFIGQGTDKQGKKGFAQREQIEVIKKFTAGEFNVLVATAIGEEGLDIGDVDLIICYDAQKTPIRMLQRVGRTGRKRAGFVHVLLAETREEYNWAKAQATYSDVQRSIVRGEQLELYADVERLLPDHIKPECLEKRMEIEEYVRTDPKKRGGNRGGDSPVAKKRKRNDDIARNIPSGASTGFVSVSELLVKGSKKRKTASKGFDPLAGEDDETDMELEAGVLVPPRRTVSTSASCQGPSKPRKSVKRASTADESGKSKKAKAIQKKAASRSKEPVIPTPSQFSQMGADDSDDMDIERGVVDPLSTSIGGPSTRLTPSPQRSRPKSPIYWSSSPDVPLADEVIDLACDSPQRSPLCDEVTHNSPKYWTSSPERPLTGDVIDLATDSAESSPQPEPESPSVPSRTSDSLQRSRSSTTSSQSRAYRTPSASPGAAARGEGCSMAWLVDEDDDPDLEIVDSSPILNRRRSPPGPRRIVEDSDIEIISDSNHFPISQLKQERLPKTNVRDPSPVFNSCRRAPSPVPIDESIEIVDDSLMSASPSKLVSSPRVSSTWPSSTVSPKAKPRLRNFEMLPPELPNRLSALSPASDHDYPEPSFPVRPPGKKRVAIMNDAESPSIDIPPPSQPRLQRKRSESSPVPCPQPSKLKKSRSKKQDPGAPRKHNPWIDIEAVHSGDELSAGSSHYDEMESESDQLFLQGLPETQVSPSYDQTLAYRQSLLSQAPSRGMAPVFAKRLVRPGAFGGAASYSNLRPSVSSSPPQDGLPDEYALGSFVVDDEEEISFTANTSSEL